MELLLCRPIIFNLTIYFAYFDSSGFRLHDKSVCTKRCNAYCFIWGKPFPTHWQILVRASVLFSCFDCDFKFSFFYLFCFTYFDSSGSRLHDESVCTERCNTYCFICGKPFPTHLQILVHASMLFSCFDCDFNFLIYLVCVFRQLGISFPRRKYIVYII